MKDKYKELDYIFSKENKYKDEDDIPMKLNEKQQRKIMKDNPTQGFDICSKCDNVQLYGTMKDINQNDFDLNCDDCFKREGE